MGRIYRKANKVVAWIGGESEATGFVKTIFGRLRALESRFGGLVILEPSEQHLRDLGLPEGSSPIWSALRYFFRRAWFQRVWVIQEVANTTQLDVTCGQMRLEWDDLVYAARCVAESPMFAATDTAQICQHIGFIDECRRMMQQGSDDRLSLFNLLYRSRRCGATDLRDKIYGLYPLVHNQSTLPEPNYEKAIDTVYKEIAIHLFRTTGRLDVLSCAGAARAPHTHSLNLPSWVPDWHSYDKSTSLAPSSKTSTFHKEYEVSQDLTKLTLNGGIIDEVVSLSDTILPFRGSLKGENINFLFQQWPDSRVLLEPTGETVRVIDIFPRSTALNDFNILSLPSISYTKDWLKAERNQLTRIFYGRRVFRSAGGRLGLVPSYTILGDRIATFSGGSVPFVIRWKENTYSLTGECFFADLTEEMLFKNLNMATKITLE
ncbi:het-6-heterokaryon incompatibility protein [Rutstroemia sp. NJR-2017a BVV2]|nr:het-6-heterokaryon incompatibility protein [Rutstroemia sp. NJR-2017a BVV2]PQE25231.1 het-6-heterokaryon incompatibility protein [Rutstroemia sp. NJR-2017a BVV2]